MEDRSSLGSLTPKVASSGSVLPRYRRAPEAAPPLVITPRDEVLLHDVWRFGLLTTSQIESLRAGDPDPALRFVSRLTLTRRLKLLFHHRYLRRLCRPLSQGSLEMVYVLDHGGARLLSLRHGEVSARSPSRLPKASALDHLLETVQVRVALTALSQQRQDAQAQAKGLELLEWLPGEKARFRAPVEAPGQRRQVVSIVPDAALVVKVGLYRHYAFLEVDRGTEAARVLAGKAAAYAAYWKDGGFARDFGVPPQMGFWVLLVAPTPKRAQTILKAVAGVGELRLLFRVALREEMTPGRIGEAVWQDGASTRLGRFYEVPNSPHSRSKGDEG